MTHVVITYAERIESEANQREHWRTKAARVKRHRITAWAECRSAEITPVVLPLEITLTRIAPRRLDDDNLASGFKATRDGIADFLGIDDGDRRLTWRYEQRPGLPKQYGVQVTLRTKEATC